MGQQENVAQTTLFERLSKTRIELGFSMRKLSRLSGVDVGYISRLEKGSNKNLSNEKAEKIAHTLNISVAWLLHGSGSKQRLPESVAEGMKGLAAEQAKWLKLYKEAHESKDEDSFAVSSLLLNCISMFEDVAGNPRLCGWLSTIIVHIHHASKGLSKSSNKAAAKRIIDKL